MSSSKKIDLQRDFLADVYLSEAQTPYPSPLKHRIRVYSILITQGGEGEVEPETRLEGQQFTKLVEKTSMIDCISCI
jgi:hypothetical protein